MKSGASDPFAEDDSAADEADEADEVPSNAAAADAAAEPADDDGATTEVVADVGEGPSVAETESSVRAAGSDDDVATEPAEPASDDDAGDGITRDQLPYVLRRDRVKDERPEVHQLFVQRETHDAAVEAERALQDRLDADLSRTDAREAIYLAGMSQLDEAESILREWGYDL